MKPQEIQAALMFAATAFAGWVLYKLYDKISGAGESAGNAIGDILAPIFVGPNVQTTASVMLPSGITVSFNEIVAEGGSLKHEGGEVYTFSYRGSKYRVVPPRRSDGVYVAVRA